MKYKNEEFIFTKKERHIIYNEMLNLLQKDKYSYLFLCNLIGNIIGDLYGKSYGIIMNDKPICERLKCLPELWAYNNGRFVWFRCPEDRLAAVQNCKRLTK